MFSFYFSIFCPFVFLILDLTRIFCFTFFMYYFSLTFITVLVTLLHVIILCMSCTELLIIDMVFQDTVNDKSSIFVGQMWFTCDKF